MERYQPSTHTTASRQRQVGAAVGQDANQLAVVQADTRSVADKTTPEGAELAGQIVAVDS